MAEKTVTANGNAQIDTAQSKFGGASGLFDGTTDYLTVPDDADWYFAANPFTVDLWFRPAAAPSAYDTLVGMWDSTPGTANVLKFDLGDSGTHPRIAMTVGSTTKGNAYVTDALTWVTGQWYHLAFVRNGSSVYIFVDGVSKALTEDTLFGTNAAPNTTGLLQIGRDPVNANRDINGHLDDIRITKGMARWTADFSVPTKQATYESQNVLLLHCNGTDGSNTFTDSSADTSDLVYPSITGIQSITL